MFKERLKIAMESRNINLTDLANGLKVSKGTISKYLNGKMQPKFEMVYSISQYLKVDLGFLLGLQDNICGNEGKINNRLFPNKEDILKDELLRQIRVICSYQDVDNLKTILSVVETLARNKNYE